ncbi:MAG: F0F1 ATP synthase subunit B [Schwartzia sp. (in: firmicutes)]
MLDINATLPVQIVNFIVLLAVLKKFAWGPLLKTMHERSAKIEKNILDADADRAKAAELKKEYEEQLSKARLRAQEITDAAAARADQETRDQKEATKLEIEKMKESARANLALEREEAAKEMKGQMVTMALAAAAKLMGRKMDEAADEALVTEFINGLDQHKAGGLSC